MTRDWNQRYATGETPWDTGQPDPHLVDLLDSDEIAPCRVLEIGCGTGANALLLAERGFDVTALDLSSLAIERARASGAAAGAAVDFRVHDFLAEDPDGGPFELVVDRAVWHVFDAAEDRARFAARVAKQLVVGGRWFTIAGSTEGPERDHGPPRRSARDLADAIEPSLELVWLREAEFAGDLPTSTRAWLALARRRVLPAQPSTLREE